MHHPGSSGVLSMDDIATQSRDDLISGRQYAVHNRRAVVIAGSDSGYSKQRQIPDSANHIRFYSFDFISEFHAGVIEPLGDKLPLEIDMIRLSVFFLLDNMQLIRIATSFHNEGHVAVISTD